jgi:hypothetical protein
MGANLALATRKVEKKICWDFAHALLELAVWLQAGEDHAIAAGSRAVLKSGCRPLGARGTTRGRALPLDPPRGLFGVGFRGNGPEAGGRGRQSGLALSGRGGEGARGA